MNRRAFMQMLMAGLSALPACRVKEDDTAPDAPEPPGPPAVDAASRIFRVKAVPDLPFGLARPNNHAGVDALLDLMADNGLSFYRRNGSLDQADAYGLVATDDVVLVKVNAQWKYRGCTNSDLVRGLVQCILDHPDGFSDIHANANDPSHTFLHLANEVFKGKPVSARLLDPIRGVFIGTQDHRTEGYRKLENVSYPCFTTDRGTRVELREGVWDGSTYRQNLKLINIPVLKHHDRGGSEITAALKHFYGLLSMKDGQSPARHYQRLGETCGKMIVSVRPPALNIIDAIWVSHRAITGYPEENTFRANQLLASQDPVALDFWAAKNVLYPIDRNARHHPDFAGIAAWLEEAQKTINDRGGLFNPERGIRVGMVTRDESAMQVFERALG